MVSEKSARDTEHDSEQSDAGTEQFDVKIPHDGYEITVTIHASAIKRAIERQEKERTEEINRKGGGAFDLSRFATVGAEPQDEKWKELAEMEVR